MYDNFAFWVSIATAIVVVLIIFKTAVVVPQQSAYVVESLGKYSRTLRAGFHVLIPFIESAAYKHSLKELAFDIPEQICITNDNVQVGVDGVHHLPGKVARTQSSEIDEHVVVALRNAEASGSLLVKAKAHSLELQQVIPEWTFQN